MLKGHVAGTCSRDMLPGHAQGTFCNFLLVKKSIFANVLCIFVDVKRDGSSLTLHLVSLKSITFVHCWSTTGIMLRVYR